MDFFLHPNAICESTRIGKNTRIWAFAHVLPGAVIGEECNLCDGVFVENEVTIGNRVTIKCGVQIWDGVTLEDDVFVGPNATFTNDPFPRARQHLRVYPKTRVCVGASIGANATILPGLTIGRRAMIGAGSVVTRSVPPHAIVVGNPARIIGYTDSEEHLGSATVYQPKGNAQVAVTETAVRDVTIHELPLVTDLRGSLSVGEIGRDIPFEVQRYFLVFDVPSAETRGEHAHRECHQFLICVSGQISVVADDGRHRQEILLNRPSLGLYIPPMVWATQYRYSSDAVLMVLASHPYSSEDYIRSYDEFMELVRCPSGNENPRLE
jgi:UDP-2-acetamido-3-amino-2,3-dideoxy-glucuronate N-acetyltransferase